MPGKPEHDLQAVVGKAAYAVWVDMLRELVPDGRTHRLPVVIAAMRQYALNKANPIGTRTETRPSVPMSLIGRPMRETLNS
jgi:hypothetical protein